MAGGNTLRFSPTEVAGDDAGAISVQGDAAHRTRLNTEFARCTLVPVESQDTFLFVSGDGSSGTGLGTGRRLTLLADKWQAEDQAIPFSPDDADG